MSKRNRSPLETTPIKLELRKYADITKLRTEAHLRWGIKNLSPFYPSLKSLFKTDKISDIADYGIKFPTFASTLDDSYKKISMITSPMKVMKGTTDETQQDISNPNNYAYVGSLFASGLSLSGHPNFPRVFGVYNGIAKEHTVDISDDYLDICDELWFAENVGKTFNIILNDSSTGSTFKHTRTEKPDMYLGEDVELEGITEIDSIATGIPAKDADITQVFNDLQVDDVSDSNRDSESCSTSDFFEIQSCDCDIDECEDIPEEDDDCSIEPFAWAVFTDVPVQITVMEKFDKTFYYLCNVIDKNSEHHLAWISQIMFALAFAQQTFGFTHNDLHSNNIMYSPTTDEFLNYSLDGVDYRIPTYGYIIKIIDFERGIGHIRLEGMKDAKLFISDHYAVDNEAVGMYNYGPYKTPKFVELKPNPSCDLARLATSMFWDLFPTGNPTTDNQRIYDMFNQWMKCDDGKSVLLGHRGIPRHDRYCNGFDLYKALGRVCHNAVPYKEIKKSEYLKTFLEQPSQHLHLQ
jgi:hypothetical protein